MRGKVVGGFDKCMCEKFFLVIETVSASNFRQEVCGIGEVFLGNVRISSSSLS